MLHRPARTLLAVLAIFLCVGLPLPAAGMVTDVDGVVYVSWSPSPSPSVVGYHVYRSASPERPFVRLNADPVPGPTYADATVTDGQMYFYAVSAVDAEGRESTRAAASTGILIAVDTEPPVVLSAAPFDGQGVPGDDGSDYGRRVPMDSGIYARLWDESGVDAASLGMMVLADGLPVAGTTSVHALSPDESTDLVVRFVPAEPLPFDATVQVGLDGSDANGNGMATAQFQFRVETEAMHAAADAAAPPATLTELDTGEFLLTADGIQVQYPASETQWIALGAPEALPPAPGAVELRPIAFLDQIQFYGAPVTVRLPLSWDALNTYQAFRVLRYHDDPAIGWQPATVGDGWLVSERLVEQQLDMAGGYLEIQIHHAAGLTLFME